MKFIDEKGRFFGKINIFDLMVVILLVALIGGVGYKYFILGNKVMVNESDIDVTLWVEDVRQITVDVINVGDVIREYDSNQLFGEIIEKQVTQHYEPVETADGRIVNAAVEGKYDVYIKLKCKGIVTDNAISIGSKEVRMGGTIITKHQLYSVSTKVVEIDLKK
ncbi:protein of unknown function [Proteiniborus ethanoligenes]|uniref:DUF4330 domain-containing protein n=1 Tax=Proteiniborus ethanoligenes TaxID=415015 RepID=A0A1H3KPX4_9FIRM|nr:DUF4330 domain-containing protein [Proteiniborus ethanoligenes]TAH63795.1 MAG: DUF4330 domain-containing protein [Gottschalkiaceae bacterium]SDY54202.1 protein of unknown function [Proteiniborus ethanoligenes]